MQITHSKRMNKERIVGAIGALTASLLLAACQFAPPMTQVDAGGIHRVGVVSVAADHLTQLHEGVRLRDQQRAVQPIAQWGVDRAYEDQIAAAIPEALGAVAVRAPAPVDELAAMNDPATPYVQDDFWDYRADPIAEELRAYCAAHQLDALVIASRSVDDDVLGGSAHPIEGAGLYARGGARLLHLSAALTLVDCATGRPLDRHRVASVRAFPASHGYPVRDIAGTVNAASPASWSADDEARIRQALIALPAQAWADTLRGMLPYDGPPAFGRNLMPDS
jgi:hypothetical protein